MLPDINKIKGIHPGAIIKREIKKRGLRKKDFALKVNVHAQTISAIIKEKRSITPGLSISLGTNLGVEPDYFMLLQASYNVKKARLQTRKQFTPDLKKIRKSLFWDTDFNKIDWERNKRSVIRRIFERGNDEEIQEIINFYGIDIVKNELKYIKKSFLPSFEINLTKYIKD
jgi:addiction module HigA family antidote